MERGRRKKKAGRGRDMRVMERYIGGEATREEAREISRQERVVGSEGAVLWCVGVRDEGGN